jgi:hypothetical protein
MTPAQNTAAYIQGFEDGKRVAQVEIKRELAQRTWVGLTDDEIDELAELHGLDLMVYVPFTDAIEAKLKELNHE